MPIVSGGTATPVAEKLSSAQQSPEETRVRGQVRMHGIIAGYRVAALLAPTLANTGAAIREEMHKIAHEVAAKIEAYSFGEDQ